jgi:hypothetical protein
MRQDSPLTSPRGRASGYRVVEAAGDRVDGGVKSALRRFILPDKISEATQ